MRRLLPGALLASVVVCALGASTSPGATGPAVIRLTDVQVSANVLGAANRTGTSEIYRQSLYGSTSKAKAIGHAFVTCLVVGGTERKCDSGYVLPRGTILTGAIVQSRLFYTAAITGGTGLYDNARGTLTVTATRLSPRREILLFRLSGLNVAAETLRPLILICDDERPLRELIKAALGDGYRFEEAADTREAEELLAGDRPALLVLDVMLPGKSGLELLGELRERPETADIPVVVISAWHGDYEVTALGNGADAFLGKPFDPDELAETVERLVAA